MRRRELSFAYVIGILLPCSALRGEPARPCDPMPAPTPVATLVHETPDAVVAGLTRSYEDRDVELYGALLHEDFEFHAAPENRHLAPPDGVCDRRRELEIAERMFGGSVGWTHGGVIVPPVTRIRLELTPLEDWRSVPDDPDRRARSYRTHLVVEFDGRPPYVVRRVQDFTVVGRRFEHDPRLSDFQLVLWREAGTVPGGPSHCARRDCSGQKTCSRPAVIGVGAELSQ